MSKFSARLKKHIEDSGITIYQLSKKADIERTSIQRSITGERLPKLNFVEKICEYLRLSPTEKTELFELYSISIIGEDIYLGRKYIKELLESIATVRFDKSISRQKIISLIGKAEEDHAVYEGMYAVNNIIRDVLEDEVANSLSPEINISMPFHNSFIFDLLYQLYLENNGEIKINNVVSFNKKDAYQNSNHNLNILSYIMPFVFSAGNGYQAYYYYDNNTSSSDIALLMPHYVITSKRLITLSADFSTAILYNNKTIVSAYLKLFKKFIAKTNPFIVKHLSCDEFVLVYLSALQDFGEITHVLEPQPCFARYYTEELIRKHLVYDIDNRETLIDYINTYYTSFRELNCDLVSIFSVEGLNSFASTGILDDLPRNFAIPFTINERIMLLSKLKNDIMNGTYKGYCANSSVFTIPLCSINLYNTNRVIFVNSNNKGLMFSSSIDEKSICEALFDFFQSLPEGNLLNSKEETVHIIEDCIDKCQSLLKESNH